MDERRDIKNVKIITKHSRERKKEVEKKANSVSNKQSWAWSLIFCQRLKVTTDIFACNENFALWLYYNLHSTRLTKERHKKLLSIVITDVLK